MGLFGYVDLDCPDPHCGFELTVLLEDYEVMSKKCPKCGKLLKHHIWYR